MTVLDCASSGQDNANEVQHPRVQKPHVPVNGQSIQWLRNVVLPPVTHYAFSHAAAHGVCYPTS
jgi:hypothetical protein